LSAVFVAFAHGSNDIANAIGPFSAILEYVTTGSILGGYSTPWYIFAIGGVGIVIGLATLGWRVIKTIGEDITKLSFPRGYAAELSTATTILFASSLGLPISTTHTLVGSVIGVGLVSTSSQKEKISQRVDIKMIGKIFAGWVVTVLAGGVLTIVIYEIVKAISRA